MDLIKVERDRAEAAMATATHGPVAAPAIESGGSQDPKIITLRVEGSHGLAETGTELSFATHEIGNDMGELVRRICDELKLGKGLGAATMCSPAHDSQACGVAVLRVAFFLIPSITAKTTANVHKWSRVQAKTLGGVLKVACCAPTIHSMWKYLIVCIESGSLRT